MLIAADTLLAVAMQGDAVSNEPSPESARPGSEAQLDIKLVWPEAVRFELESAPYEIVVRYDRRLEAEEIAKFTAAAGKLLGDLRWNDASLVIRPAPGYRIGVEASERALQFRFVKEDDAAPETPQAVAQSPAIELELTRAGADAAAGYPGQARKRLAILAKAHPAEQQVQRALADAEAADGATALAAHRYKAMGADDRIARRVIAELKMDMRPLVSPFATARPSRSGKPVQLQCGKLRVRSHWAAAFAMSELRLRVSQVTPASLPNCATARLLLTCWPMCKSGQRFACLSRHRHLLTTLNQVSVVA